MKLLNLTLRVFSHLSPMLSRKLNLSVCKFMFICILKSYSVTSVRVNKIEVELRKS